MAFMAKMFGLSFLVGPVVLYIMGMLDLLHTRLVGGGPLRSPGDESAEPFKRRATMAKSLLSDCTNIHCEKEEGCSDLECGGLWKGERLSKSKATGHFKSVAFVISHCLHSLDWVTAFTRRTPVHSITIITKCNSTIVGAPPNAEIIVLPNVGRCDHSYAYWIRHHYVDNGNSPDVVIFLKDDRSKHSIHQAGSWTSLPNMLHTTYEQEFSCGMRPSTIRRKHIFYLSAYHDTNALMKFAKKEYQHHSDKYSTNKTTRFESRFQNLGAWVKHMRLDIPQNLMQACYGGSFGASMEAIRSHEEIVWIRMLDNLSRGDSIEEGHFAERVWAALLAKPPTDYEIALLRNYSDGLANYSDSYVGTLKRLLPR
jgi:hypothetical protein